MDYDRLVELILTEDHFERSLEGKVLFVKNNYTARMLLRSNSFTVGSSVDEFVLYGDFNPHEMTVEKLSHPTRLVIKKEVIGNEGSFFNKKPIYQTTERGEKSKIQIHLYDEPHRSHVRVEETEGVVSPPVLEMLRSMHNESEKWTIETVVNTTLVKNTHIISYPGIDDIEYGHGYRSEGIIPLGVNPFSREEMGWFVDVLKRNEEKQRKQSKNEKRQKYIEAFSK